MPDHGTAAGGRRVATGSSRRASPLVVLAVLIPLLTVAALLLVQPPEPSGGARPPAASPLTRATLVCPAALPGTTEVRVGHTDPRVRGTVTTRVGRQGPVRLAGGPATVPSREPLVLVAEGQVAPGLLAGRGDAAAATRCGDPLPDQWFTGVSAGPEHASVLTLVNPDAGSAVADVTVLGPTGPVEAARLRGVTVPGRGVATFDLAEVIPSRELMALRVQVTRGRLGAHVVDRVEEIGGGAASAGWLPAQPGPATTSYLLGIGDRAERSLVLANPGDDEARAELRVVTRRSEFTPAGAEEVRIEPGTIEVVDVGDLFAGRTAEAAVGLRVESTVPVTATLRAAGDGSLTHAVAGEFLTDRAAAMVPAGPARLTLAGADALGVATVTTRDRAGRRLAQQRVEVGPGRAAVADLPEATGYVEVDLDRTGAVASVEVGDDVVLPLTGLVLTGQVPDVAPAIG